MTELSRPDRLQSKFVTLELLAHKLESLAHYAAGISAGVDDPLVGQEIGELVGRMNEDWIEVIAILMEREGAPVDERFNKLFDKADALEKCASSLRRKCWSGQEKAIWEAFEKCHAATTEFQALLTKKTEEVNIDDPDSIH